MPCNVCFIRDSLNPTGSRTFFPVEAGLPLSILSVGDDKPHIIIRNGLSVLRKDWENIQIKNDDIISVIMLPLGGDGGSNPLTIIAMIGIAYLAPWAFQTAAGWAVSSAGLGMGWSGAMAVGYAAQAAVLVGGSMLVNAFLSPSSPQAAKSLQEASPTYSVSAQGNSARIDSAIPLQYGRMKMYPDFAALPYLEYSGNEQYLYQSFSLGLGWRSIESINIEDTKIYPIGEGEEDPFDEVEIEIINPGGTLTLFPANVVSSNEASGQEILLGEPVGPFVANQEGTVTEKLGLDFVFPKGIFVVNPESGNMHEQTIIWQVTAQEIDDIGEIIGSPIVFPQDSITLKTTTPHRISNYYSVPSGRYQVTVARIDEKNEETNYGHEITWGGLRVYLQETRDFGEITLLAVKIRASNNISQLSARRINVVSTAMINDWDEAGWTDRIATSSIGLAIVDAARKHPWGDDTIGYGMGLNVNQTVNSDINLDMIKELDAIWASRGDEFNGIFDTTITAWEAITKICRAGRAKPFMQGGKLYVARDGLQTNPVALFSMRNIIKDSFSIQYLMPTEETSDSVQVTYHDQQTWSNRTVKATLPGTTNVITSKTELFGVTSRKQAYQDGLYTAASNQRRRKIISFSTEMDGFIPSYGDLVAIAHDMPAWGQSSEVVNFSSESREIIVSEPIIWTEGQTHYVGLAKEDGSVSGPYEVIEGSDSYRMILTESLDFTPYFGNEYEKTRISFGPAETWRQPAKVTSVSPKGIFSVDLTCISEDEYVHTVDQDIYVPPVQYSQLPNMFTVPRITRVYLRYSFLDEFKAFISWEPAAGARHYQIDMAYGSDPTDPTLIWTRVGDGIVSCSYSTTAVYEYQTLIRVRGIGVCDGPWKYAFYGSSFDIMWSSGTELIWNVDDTTLMWRS